MNEKITNAALAHSSCKRSPPSRRGVESLFGTRAMSEVITTMVGLGLAKRIASDAFERLVEGTGLGTKLDALRGAINQVSLAAVRIYRVRGKLDAKKGA